MQDVSYIVLDQEKDCIEKMAVSLFKEIKPLVDLLNPMAKNHEIDDHFFFFNAPAVIVILAKSQTNGILVAQSMESVVEAHGLDVLYSGYFTMAASTPHKIKNAMSVPRGKRAAMTLVLSYPDAKFYCPVQHEKLDVTYKQMVYTLAR